MRVAIRRMTVLVALELLDLVFVLALVFALALVGQSLNRVYTEFRSRSEEGGYFSSP